MLDEEINDIPGAQEYQWFRLDNAAKVFPAVLSTRVTTVFRISVTLKEPVTVSVLQTALGNIMPRFPYFRVHLRRGLFWYYFETNPGTPEVQMENPYPCSRINLTRHVFPFRVIAYGRRIALEVSHMLTDGAGVLTFLKALTAEYLSLKGVPIDDWGDIFRKDDEPKAEEFEYAYRKHYRKNIPGPPKLRKAFHIPYKLEKRGIYRIITGTVSSNVILNKAKEYNVSISVFLSGLLIESIYSMYKELPVSKQQRVIRLLLAVNMRKIYPSETMRNFTLMVTPEIDPRLGDYTFQEILEGVHHYLAMEVTEKLLSRQLSRNVGGEVHVIGRVIPRVLKDVFFATVFKTLGEFLTTLSISNIGRVSLPDCLVKHVERFDFIQVPSPIAKKNCSIISFEESMYISFGRVIAETNVERFFFSRMSEMGVPVKIETN
ncbi:MAG: hypothetical protein JEY99_20970 [Spirochaetales bacterium]|nr:hypothetical protein [Spirochaetales bacterium]